MAKNTMTNGSETKRTSPPYGSFKSFRGFIDTLHSTVTPDHIDRSMMSKMSGVTQTEILAAMRFFGLIGADDRATKMLRELVNSFGTDKWPGTLGSIIQPAYSAIIGDLNIKTATAKSFSDRFKAAANLDGYGLEKALRFYLAALREAKVSVSPLFKITSPPRKRPTGATEDKPTSPESVPNKSEGNNGEQTIHPPKGTIEYPLYFKNKAKGAIFIPTELTADDVTVIEKTIAVIKAYVGVETGTTEQAR